MIVFWIMIKHFKAIPHDKHRPIKASPDIILILPDYKEAVGTNQLQKNINWMNVFSSNFDYIWIFWPRAGLYFHTISVDFEGVFVNVIRQACHSKYFKN